MWNSPREEAQDKIFLPICMEYCQCYKRYVASFGYKAQSTKSGGFIISPGEEGEEVDKGEFVSFPMYRNYWKKYHDDLKVSHPVEVSACSVTHLSIAIGFLRITHRAAN